MGLFGRTRRKIDPHVPQWGPPSSNLTGRHGFYGSDRRPPQNDRIRELDPGRPINGRRQFPRSPDLCPHHSRDQDTIQVFPRDPEELHEESFCRVTPDTGTDYPCTKKELDASGGTKRQILRDLDNILKHRTIWFAHPNNGPFIDARKAAREIFDHNDLKRTPSATENEAISRLIAGFENAGREPWGPELAIKAFCDLDEVFFCGRLNGHVFMTWISERNLDSPEFDVFADTKYVGAGKCVIRMNAYTIFFSPMVGSVFDQMFGTLLHEMCHAYQFIRALEHGPKGWRVGKAGGHGKNFGTKIQAVNERAWVLLGLQGDPKSYPCHEYALDDDPRPGPQHLRPHIHTLPRNRSRIVPSHMSRQQLYDAAFADVTLDSGSDYECTQNDLEATGGLARQEYQDDDHKYRKASKRTWFSKPNHGPFVTGRQASRDIFEHNDLRRKPNKFERVAIERLSEAIDSGRRGDWSPDLIIKAFCDLDIVFFGGQLRGHVCVRWQPDWSEPGGITWGTTVFLHEGKCAIRLNADKILLDHSRHFESMFGTMLHEMCHADADVRVHERGLMECASHGKNFGTKWYAVQRRAQRLFGLSLKVHPGEVYPRHKYEKGEGYP